MAKRKILLPDYPRILLTPLGASWNGADIDDCLDALAGHYRLEGRFSDLPSPIGVLPDKEAELWMGLAWGLMQDFVPAFGEKKHGRPKTKYTTATWLHGARLVQIVRAVRQMLKEKGLPSTTQATYVEVARILKKKPAPRWRYGKLATPLSFAQEWKKIPRHVKKYPDWYIPLDPSHVRKTAMSDMELHLLSEALRRDLPPIPTKLISQ